MNKKQKIFICYVHQDIAFKEVLLKHLRELDQQNLLEVWDDGRLQADIEYRLAIEKTLAQCHTLLLLMSRDFMASKFVTHKEIPMLLKHHYQTNQIRIVPIILKACDWQELIFSKANALPKNFVPIERVLYPNQEWGLITQKIHQWCEDAGVRLINQSSVPRKVDISRLPQSMTPFVGRMQHLTEMDRALNNKDIGILSIIAPGGIGKSALIETWLKRISPTYGGARQVFAWSFYGRGHPSTYVSSTDFLSEALPFFGHEGELPPTEDARGRRLAELMREKTGILILDGIEPLQYQQGEQYSEFADVSLKTLLHDIQLHGLPKGPRLIIISSRQPLVELQDSPHYQSIQLAALSGGEGARLLVSLGVKGLPRQLTEVASTYGGQSLALALLSKMLIELYASDVHQHTVLPPLFAKESPWGHAQRIFRFYEEHGWLKDAPEQIFLSLLGLLDRPLGINEREILIRRVNFARSLTYLTEIQWMHMLSGLHSLGLIFEGYKDGEVTWDTHPLIRHYFGERLRHQSPADWQQAHRVLFNYFQSVACREQDWSALSLFHRSMYHGCLAGEYQRVLALYRQRLAPMINDSSRLSAKNAYSADLAVLTHFFQPGWLEPFSDQQLSPLDQDWLYQTVGNALKCSGRLSEAIALYQLELIAEEGMQHWENIAKVLENLVELLILVGRITDAYTTTQSVVVKTSANGSSHEQMIYHTTLAVTLYRLGQLAESQKQFQIAATLQKNQQISCLSGLSGIYDATILLEMASDQTVLESLLLRGQTLLAEATSNRREKIFAHLFLGQVFNILRRFDESQTHLEIAIAEAEETSDITLIPEVFLKCADFYRQRGDFERAQNDLERAIDIISCWKLQLYEVEACLLKGNLLLDREHEEKFSYLGGKLPPHLVLLKLDTTLKEAEHAYRRADELIRTMNYRLKFAELSLLATRLAYHTRRPADALVHLQTARQFIDKLGCWRILPFWKAVKAEIELPLS